MMDNFDESEDARKALDELYTRFCDQLNNEGSFSEYTEDELIDIYDRARDLDNIAVQNAVMDYWVASRISSAPLAERKAMRLLDEGEQEAAWAYAKSTLDNSSLIYGMLRLLVASENSNEALAALFDKVLPDSLDDETIIRFIEFILLVNRIDWVRDNVKWLSGFCEYPASMYYEVSRVALERNEVEWGLPLVQKLTMLEPYNFDYWIYLANVYYYYSQKIPEALEAVDFALAIKPGASDALLLKAKLMIENSASETDVQDILKKVLESEDATNDQIEEAYFCQAVSYGGNATTRDSALEALCRAMGVGGNARRIGDVAMIVGFIPFPEKLKKVLSPAIKAMPEDEFLTWVDRLFFNEKQLEGTIELFLARYGYNRITEASAKEMNVWLEALYRSKRIPELIALFEEYFNGEMNAGIDFPASVLYVMARLKMRLTQGLVAMIDKLLNEVETSRADYAISSRLRIMGSVLFLKQAREMAMGAELFKTDPFFSDL